MPDIKFNFDSFTIFNASILIEGWLFGTDAAVESFFIHHPRTGKRLTLRCELTSPDVAAVHGPRAARARFRLCAQSPFVPEEAHELELVVESGNHRHTSADFLRGMLLGEAVHQTFRRFLAELEQRDAGKVVEIGARARSGIVRKAMIPSRFEYIGIDVMPGDNVDLVLDAHHLAAGLPHGSIDAIFCFSVFEHLLMPWKVALEINRVLKPGGLGFIMTHQAWPVHDAPCDYWRFSDRAWHALFNPATGFAILDSQMSDPAYLVPKLAYADRPTGAVAQNFLQTAVVFIKIADTRLTWDVSPQELGEAAYPA